MHFPNWAKNILFLLVYMISGLVLIIVIEGLSTGTELLPFNTAIESIVAHLRTPLLTTSLVVVTHLGDPFVLSFLALVIASILAIKGDAYDAMLIVVVMVMSVAGFTILKDTFQIARPGSDIFSYEGWAFPSGHATVATAFFFILAHSFFRKARTLVKKTVLVTGSIVATLLICFSRLYLGAHWGLDVLAGIALGLLTVSFTILVFSVFFEDRLPRDRVGL